MLTCFFPWYSSLQKHSWTWLPMFLVCILETAFGGQVADSFIHIVFLKPTPTQRGDLTPDAWMSQKSASLRVRLTCCAKSIWTFCTFPPCDRPLQPVAEAPSCSDWSWWLMDRLVTQHFDWTSDFMRWHFSLINTEPMIKARKNLVQGWWHSEVPSRLLGLAAWVELQP